MFFSPLDGGFECPLPFLKQTDWVLVQFEMLTNNHLLVLVHLALDMFDSLNLTEDTNGMLSVIYIEIVVMWTVSR